MIKLLKTKLEQNIQIRQYIWVSSVMEKHMVKDNCKQLMVHVMKAILLMASKVDQELNYQQQVKHTKVNSEIIIVVVTELAVIVIQVFTEVRGIRIFVPDKENMKIRKEINTTVNLLMIKSVEEAKWIMQMVVNILVISKTT